VQCPTFSLVACCCGPPSQRESAIADAYLDSRDGRDIHKGGATPTVGSFGGITLHAATPIRSFIAVLSCCNKNLHVEGHAAAPTEVELKLRTGSCMREKGVNACAVESISDHRQLDPETTFAAFHAAGRRSPWCAAKPSGTGIYMLQDASRPTDARDHDGDTFSDTNWQRGWQEHIVAALLSKNVSMS
jgi:hypothetical protein